MNIGDEIFTPNGKGEVAGFEKYSKTENNRVGIILENNPFNFPVAFYFLNEITK